MDLDEFDSLYQFQFIRISCEYINNNYHAQ